MRPEDTEALAASLAPGLRAGDVIYLQGDLGGGKTTWTRGLMKGLGHPDPREVASPTFALHHRYVGGRLPVDHLDLYRLEGVDALRRQGVLDPLDDPTSVCVIEWAERLEADASANPTLDVGFEFVDETTRALRLTFHGARGAQWHAAWMRHGKA